MPFGFDRRRAIAGGLVAAWSAKTPLAAAPMTNGDDVIDNPLSAASYSAMAMQLTARSLEALPDEASARAAMLDHIEGIEQQIRTSSIFVAQYSGKPVKLVVLPEYLFTSYPGRVSIPDFAKKVGWAADGPEYDALGKVAQRLGLFLAGNTYETDKAFPDFYFQTCFIVDPSGAVVLRYRRLLSMFAPSPHDVWEAYLDTYGLEGVFPVARTEIGNLAAIASEEILYPEIARALALRGAEVFCHNSSEVGSPVATNKDIAKQARAFENLAYVVSSNTAGISGTAMPLSSAEGNSQVVDWKGRVMAQSGDGETFTAFAQIDLGALREARRTPAMTNYLARQRPGLFAEAYAAAAEPFRGPNGMMNDGKPAIPERDYFRRAQAEVIDRLDRAGAI
ncbi:MAG: nitrilase-related carbon-nitrogen hydrolase [Pseudomonadota bacterium]